MATITKTFSVFFSDTGVPKTGLAPIISIYQLDLLFPASEVIVGASLLERGGGHYTYDFAAFDTTKNYSFTADGGAILAPWDRYKAGTVVCEDAAGIEEFLAGAHGAGAWDAVASSIDIQAIVDGILDETVTDHLTAESVGEAIAIVRGLSQQNFVLDNTVYSDNSVLLEGRVRIWDTAANVGTGVGVIATYEVTAIEGTPGTVAQHKVEKV